MKYVPEDIMEALNIIKETCKDHDEDCYMCPFNSGSEEGCLIKNEYPNEWNINWDSPTVWRALH